MSKPLTPLETAEAAHAEAVEAFRTARSEYHASVEAANVQIAELNRLDAAIKAGDSSVAGQRLTTKAKADDLTEVVRAYQQAVEVSIVRRDAAYMDLIVERLRTSAGAMRSTATIRQMEAAAQVAIDEILFRFADEVAAHNEELTSTVAAVKSAQKGRNVRSSVSVRDDSSGKVLHVDGVEYREQAPSFVLGNVVGHPALRWNEDRNSEALAALRAAHAERAAEQARLANEASDARAAVIAIGEKTSNLRTRKR